MTRVELWLFMAAVVAVTTGALWGMSAADARVRSEMERAAKWRWEHITGPQMEQCRKLGGVPILSSWDGQLKRCDFPAVVKP